MNNVLVVSPDNKLKNFIIQNEIGDYSICEYKKEIFQGLRTLIQKEFDILVYNIDLLDIHVLSVLKIAKGLNKEINLIVENGDCEFLPLKSTDKANIYYLQFKPREFTHLKFHLDELIKREVSNAKQH